MLINAEARVVAVFTLVTALLFGTWGALDHLASSIVSASELGRLVVALVPFVLTALAVQATRAVDAPWARILGGAAVLIGAVDSVGAVLYFIAYT